MRPARSAPAGRAGARAVPARRAACALAPRGQHRPRHRHHHQWTVEGSPSCRGVASTSTRVPEQPAGSSRAGRTEWPQAESEFAVLDWERGPTRDHLVVAVARQAPTGSSNAVWDARCVPSSSSSTRRGSSSGAHRARRRELSSRATRRSGGRRADRGGLRRQLRIVPASWEVASGGTFTGERRRLRHPGHDDVPDGIGQGRHRSAREDNVKGVAVTPGVPGVDLMLGRGADHAHWVDVAVAVTWSAAPPGPRTLPGGHAGRQGQPRSLAGGPPASPTRSESLHPAAEQPRRRVTWSGSPDQPYQVPITPVPEDRPASPDSASTCASPQPARGRDVRARETDQPRCRPLRRPGNPLNHSRGALHLPRVLTGQSRPPAGQRSLLGFTEKPPEPDAHRDSGPPSGSGTWRGGDDGGYYVHEVNLTSAAGGKRGSCPRRRV